MHFVPWYRGSGCLGAAVPVTGAAADEYVCKNFNKKFQKMIEVLTSWHRNARQMQPRAHLPRARRPKCRRETKKPHVLLGPAWSTPCTVAGAQLCRGDDGAFFDAMCNQTDLVKNTNKYTVFTVLPYPTGGKRGPRVLCLYPLS